MEIQLEMEKETVKNNWQRKFGNTTRNGKKIYEKYWEMEKEIVI